MPKGWKQQKQGSRATTWRNRTIKAKFRSLRNTKIKRGNRPQL